MPHSVAKMPIDRFESMEAAPANAESNKFHEAFKDPLIDVIEKAE